MRYKIVIFPLQNFIYLTKGENMKIALIVRRILLLVSVVALSVASAALKEGSDYEVLKNPIPNAKNSVIEVYSYACPFCYKYTKIIPSVIKSLPSGVVFKPYHLRQKGDGQYGKIASQVFAVAIAQDNKANISIHDSASAFHKAQSAYFDEYHAKKNRWNNGKDEEGFLQTGLKASGISKADYEKALNDKAVKDLLDEWEASYEVGKIQGVPAFVVNGKYLIYTKSITSMQDLEAKIKELLKK